MSSIPEEIYLEILLRVPVQTTFVCKCVCKSWLALISSIDFVKRRLNITIQINNPKIMLKYHKLVPKSAVIYSANYDSLSSSMNEFVDDAVEMDYPMGFWKPIGTCDGLVCCISFELSFEGCIRDVIFLWNPTTQEYKELPVSPNDSSDSKEVAICGFGYDSKIDDYKVVKLLQYREDFQVDRTDPSHGMSSVDVYTMGSNSWKSIGSVPYTFPICCRSGALVNGALHWLGHSQAQDNSLVVVSLNISEERFEDMQLPKQPSDKNTEFISVGVLEGRLCVIVNVDDIRFEIWRMQDYGVRESWNICHVITNERVMNDYYLMLVWFRNGEILFKIPSDLVFYDPKNGTARKANIHSSMILVSQEIYFESLVSVNSGTYVEPRGNRGMIET
ncbi:F-box/kelch-repeat protein At3g06240-like [Papaver somniferum]|uniref:F-box/kelch-repeat protein At3g06240-like n=1 Tax=Papaver somniferum TaxID=3469 RepID=UPI000E6FC787|nr:F-box/kelch-repeat protein At3g06240-like [Papaver somniferum]